MVRCVGYVDVILPLRQECKTKFADNAKGKMT